MPLPDLVGGLPLHPLIVHAVVVLLPLAAAGTVAVVLLPRLRRAYAPLVALLATAGTAIVPFATESGDTLMRLSGPPAGAHMALGNQLIYLAVPFTVLLWLFVLLDRRATAARVRADRATDDRDGDGRPHLVSRRSLGAMAATREPGTRRRGGRGVATVVGILALVAALATAFQVYRIGDSGARSVWGEVGTSQQAG